MADKTTPEYVPGAPEYEFVTVSSADQTVQENKIQFEMIGDTWTADKYLGMRDMGSYEQARFQKGTEIFFVNANYSLRDGLKNVRPNTGPVRLTFTEEVDTGQAQPMRVFTVEVARRRITNTAVK